MKRSFGNWKFFAVYLGQNLLLMTVVAAVLAVFVGLGASAGAAGAYILNAFYYYMLMIGLFVFVIMVMSCYQSYQNVILSFGCTRKRFLLGMQMYELAFAGVLLVVYVLGRGLVLDGRTVPGGWILMAAAGILAGSMADILAAVYLKFGKIGTVLMMIAFAGSGMGVGLYLSSGNMDIWRSFSEYMLVSFGWIQILLIAFVMDLLGIFLITAVVSRYEVRQ